MKVIDVFEENNKTINRYFEDLYKENGDKPVWVDHCHVCDFDILSRINYHKHPKKWANKMCKKYLKEHGETLENENGEPFDCDLCPHCQTIYFSPDNFLLGITSIDKDTKQFYHPRMVKDLIKEET